MNYKLAYDKAKELIELYESCTIDSPFLEDAEEAKRLRSELQSVEREEKPKRKGRYIPKVKICAGCGSFAHGNPGHDII